MKLENIPIQRKLMSVILLTCATVLLIACSVYYLYERYTLRKAMDRHMTMLGEVIASNCTAALAFDNPEDASEILSALRAEENIKIACLYDEEGKLFSWYPENANMDELPGIAGPAGYTFHRSHLSGFQPVVQDGQFLGTLYLKSDLKILKEQSLLFGKIIVLVIVLSFVLAYLVSKGSQNVISNPILKLTETARVVSDHHDYTIRAPELGSDELGQLTDSFNNMLEIIHGQNNVLRESEERVRLVIDSSLNAIIVMNDEGLITDWNASAEKMFGWKSSEVIGLEKVEKIIPLKHRMSHRNGLQKFLSTGEGSVINNLIEISALRKNGQEFPIELSVKELKVAGEKAFCGFITDITERKKAEEDARVFNKVLEQKVKNRTKELEIANRELESFSYSVSHDLRTPLRAINGYVSIFSEDYGDILDKDGKKILQTILRNSRKMGMLIDDLLEFSRLGRTELVRSKVLMAQLVKDIYEDLRKMENNRLIESIIDPLPDTFADIGAIRQVWENLISNALKYTRKKEKAIIEIGSFKKGKTSVYYIRDNGAGFEMKYYEKLFGVFQRLHSMEEFEGTGVGLAIVHRIVEKHNGSIWAESKPDEGAAFYFTLNKRL